jgi:hypothetical protein
MIQDAILMRLQAIGEHLARPRQIEAERFAAMADESWWQIIGPRNVISHGYGTFDRPMIWRMITDDLPAFAASLDWIDQFSLNRVSGSVAGFLRPPRPPRASSPSNWACRDHVTLHPAFLPGGEGVGPGGAGRDSACASSPRRPPG